MSILMVVIDGVSDRPVNGKTPLSSAKTPNLDKLAEMGINGIMDTVSPGIRPGSDTSHLALLGYDPFKYYTGRGPIEAAGVGIELKPGDVAFRVNFATVKGEGTIFDKIVVDRRAGRIEDTSDLIKAIEDELDLPVKFILKKGTGHRAALVLRGDNLSHEVTDTDPKKVGRKVKTCKAKNKEALETAEIVNIFTQKTHEILEDHPLNQARVAEGKPKANALLLRGAGGFTKIKSFEEKYGLKLAVVSATALIRGVCRLVGGEVIDVEGATGNVHTNIGNKIKAAIEALDHYDVVLLHFKATDELGHDKNFEGKTKFIEKLDSYFKEILNLDFSKICLIITADHSTPVSVGDHTADPVPVTIVHDGVRVDDVKKFSEFEVYKGGLCRISGRDLLRIALDLINKAKKFGA